jgi:hypothetical protein
VFVGSSNCKVVNPPHDINMFPWNNAAVEARFVDGWDKSNITKDSIGMFFPESRRFRVTLHCGEDRDDMSSRE